MRNVIEEGTQRPTEQAKISNGCGEIFNTVIKILQAKGQLSKGGFFNRYQTYQVFLHAVNDPLQNAVNVEIVAGANLAKARKVSINVGWLRLDVIKKSVDGQDTYMGKEFNEHSGHKEELNGNRQSHINAVSGFLKDIRRVSSEIIPQSH